MKTGSKVYVIIVTYNAMKWIDKCFSSLRKSKKKVSTVVIDNGSKDETIQFLHKNYPEVYIIKNNVNQGFGQANNQGIEYAYDQGATNFFLLNQDAWIYPDTIEKLIKIQDEYNIALVAPIHLNGSGKKMDHQYFSYVVTEDHNNELVSDLMLNQVKPYYIVSYVNAAAWMLSRQCIEVIGGFDPIYFHYGEDRNYCQRLNYHHEQVAVVPSSYINHDRKINGNDQMYNKRAVVSILLKTYTDINQPVVTISSTRIKLHLWLLKKSVTSLLKFHFIEWWYVVQGYCMFFCLIPKIKKSRTRNMQKGESWLHIVS